MNFQEKINQDLIEALKSKDELKTSVLRMLKSAMKNKEIALGKELSDEEIIDVISKEIKQRRDSVVQYKEGNRAELAEKEEKEIDILSVYLPEQLGADELKKIVEQSITKLNASGSKDIGKVMGMVMSQVKGKADGTLVAQLVKEKLQG